MHSSKIFEGKLYEYSSLRNDELRSGISTVTCDKKQEIPILISSPTRILIAPLNWGLGHATRCMPIIHELLQYPVEVILASDGRALQLLQKEFPQLTCIELPAYDVHYRSANMIWNIGYQVPKILRAIYKEKKAIQRIIQDHQIGLIISDNRYGCYHPSVQTIFMTHQVNLKIPFKALEKITNSLNHLWLKKFDAVWIPDYQEDNNLAGTLSRSAGLKNVTYLGPLSRFMKKDIPIKYDAIIVLSGPEPQRSILEKKIIKQAQLLPYQFLMVQGKPEVNKHFFIKNIEVHSFLTAEDLNTAILASQVVISRSGYSTLMDLVVLEKKAIFIPTPGQTEQEYLAEQVQVFFQNQFYSQNQKDLDVEKALKEISTFERCQPIHFQKNRLKSVLSQLLNNRN